MSDPSLPADPAVGGYIELDLVSDADAFVEQATAWMEDRIPGYVSRPGNVETVLLEANAQIAAEVIEQASQVPPVIFAYLGQALLGIAVRDGAPAIGVATFTFAEDAEAGVIDAGAELAVPSVDGEAVVFATDDPVQVPEGGGTVVVDITAVEDGIAGNGAFGLADQIEVTDGVDSIYVSSAAGGEDVEDDDAYLDRLADAMTILAPRPILPNDFAIMARTVDGVGRAVALDLFQPATADGGYGEPRDASRHENVERCCTVAILGDDGGMPTTALMQTVYDLLDSNREVNFLVYVVPPGENGAPTGVDVRATVVANPGADPDETRDRAESILAEWLSPANFGDVASAGGQWVYQDRVRLYEAVDFLNRAESVHYVDTVELKKTTDSTWAAADLVLGGIVPLPTLGTAEITVIPA